MMPTTQKMPCEAIPEYFAKPQIVESLAAAHPTLLVRQMALEILRLRAALEVTQRENESLRAECGIRQIDGYKNGKADAEAEAAAMRKDAERLDWLDRNYHYIDMSDDGQYYRWQFSTPQDNRGSSPVRDRIDDALAGKGEK
jgi:hypothetical protein